MNKYILLVFGILLILSACSTEISIPENSSNLSELEMNDTNKTLENTNTINIELEVIEDEESIKGESFLVTYIVDGDTFELSTGERVRLICVDTPEKGDEGYQEAKEYLSDLVLDKEVELVKDVSETDQYGRLLRYVYLDDLFVNYELVHEGLAKVYRYPPDIEYCGLFEEAEEYAKATKLGIWSEEETYVQPESTSSTETSDSSSYICSYNAYNCGDFSSHAEAQQIFEACGGVSNDVHELDGDDDGDPCESLP